jgi:hypothetical protein
MMMMSVPRISLEVRVSCNRYTENIIFQTKTSAENGARRDTEANTFPSVLKWSEVSKEGGGRVSADLLNWYLKIVSNITIDIKPDHHILLVSCFVFSPT